MNNNGLGSLNQKMRCGIFTNTDGQVLIVHDQEIPHSIEWIEYDESERSISLILEDGALQNLGVNIDQKMHNNLINGIEITLTRVMHGAFSLVQTVVLIVKDY